MDANLRLVFALAMLLTVQAMKVASLRLRRAPVGWRFVATPLPSIATWEGCPPWDAEQRRAALRRFLLFLPAFAAAWGAARWASTTWHPSPLALAYLAVPAVLLAGEAAGPFAQLAWSPLGRGLPLHHRLPLLAPDLSEFWGRRWNTWASDWFRDVLFRPLRHRPLLASFAVFVYSGLWHELLIPVPMYLLTGVNVIGTMLAFFLVQWVAVLVDRRLPRALRRPFLYVAVIAPAPLFITEPSLRLLGLW
jgi:hypothetical protein